MSDFDVIIIGKGPAGISAALYTVRANLGTLVVGKDESALLKASQIENYYGFEQPVSGEKLLSTGVKQAERLGAKIIDAEVTALEYVEYYTIKTASGVYSAKAVLIATGQAPRRPKIPGIAEFEGKGVSYCTTCDGFFYKGKIVGILGKGDYALQEAEVLEPFTNDITLFTNGEETVFTGNYADKASAYKIIRSKILGLTGGKTLEQITLESGAETLDGLFVASGTASSVDFAVKLGVSVRDNAILTDQNQRTNLEGVFAAGDCTGGFKQVSVAVGQGAAAGKSMIDFIRQKKT